MYTYLVVCALTAIDEDLVLGQSDELVVASVGSRWVVLLGLNGHVHKRHCLGTILISQCQPVGLVTMKT